ncbi:MAG: adenylate/guanylate cyclase domain-containing protein, partial [Marivirga sp.]|nr:adenylate/guanylate cyclase domain-containing protein [Marivirga sp.]
MNNSSAQYWIKSTKLLVIIISWLLIGLIITVYDYFTLHADFSSGSDSSYTFGKSMLLNTSVGFVAALLGGSFLVFFVNDRFRGKSYLRTILMVTGSFAVVSSLLIVVVSFVGSWLKYGNTMTWAVMKIYLLDSMHIKNMLVWSIVVAFTQFAIQVNDKFGKGVLVNLLLGRYHQPKEETRIFMFVDLLSSTAIAEKLNIEGYHRFLRDFFADITNAIVYNRGEIYQYVGDEIVISWKLKENIADNRCLQCYFDMRLRISQLASRYNSKYGVVPD